MKGRGLIRERSPGPIGLTPDAGLKTKPALFFDTGIHVCLLQFLGVL